MIQQIADKYQKLIAAVLLTVCYSTMILPTQALAANRTGNFRKNYYNSSYNSGILNKNLYPVANINTKESNKIVSNNFKKPSKLLATKELSSPAIGGPSQPEMSAFKSVGTDNMVNLFTGDFSYNIPLLDVGGYPVNIFYDGGVGMEQEASWVGLGWNINPGNVNRNMRGVPDDFNGEDILKQTQVMKPNVNWGVNFGASLELFGKKKPKKINGSVGVNLGVSFNNYLGPALELGVKGNTGINLGGGVDAEKSAVRLGGGLSVNASSRSGVTISPSLSLTSKKFKTDENARVGFGMSASTSYNSRNGIKAIQISEQMSFYTDAVKRKGITSTSGSSVNTIGLLSNTISFTKPSYIPSIRMPLTNTAWTGRFQVGGAFWGVHPNFEVEVYKQKSVVNGADKNQEKPLVGYFYMQNANENPHAVMDFTRFNDNEVTPTTPIISAPQYSYDVFSIQGEGTGGSIRAYRNDEGYIRDNYTRSKDNSFGLGGDLGIGPSLPSGVAVNHYGGNFNIVNTPTTIGEWNAGNNLKKSLPGFTKANGIMENVYFRNPGETSVLNEGQYNKIGGDSLVRFKLGGIGRLPTVNPVLEKFGKNGVKAGEVSMLSVPNIPERKKRTQVISFLNAEEASFVGLDRDIKTYDPINILSAQNILKYDTIERVSEHRKKHHISQINVTEASGQRYIYGIPVYNIVQKDFTFTVELGESNAPNQADKVVFSANEASNASTHVQNSAFKDGYVQITETPAFANSFLLQVFYLLTM